MNPRSRRESKRTRDRKKRKAGTCREAGKRLETDKTAS